MTVKYRVTDLAKDFGLSSNNITDILLRLSDTPKKSQTALSEDELDFVIDVITAEHQAESFDAYFAAGEDNRKKAADRRAAEKERKLAEQAAILEQFRAAAEAQKAVEEQKAAEAQKEAETKRAAEVREAAENRTKQEEKSVEAREAGKPVSAEVKPNAAAAETSGGIVGEKKDGGVQAASKPGTVGEARPVGASQSKSAQAAASKPFGNKPAEENKREEKPVEHKVSIPIAPKKKDKPAGEAPNRGPAEIRKVDTKAYEVNMERYNEKYENIAPANSMRDNEQHKQKIKQKSQEYRRPKSSKRETEADKLRRLQLEKIKKTPITVTVGDEITVGELAAALKKTAAEVIKTLMKLGMMVTVNQVIDYDTAEIVVSELGAKIERQVVVTIEERIMDTAEDKAEDLKPRDPVVCVMGHVDHGKTSLLDAIRNTAVTDTEAGGITQSIGAYRVNHNGHNITFIDTPGHAAFTSMRQRGAMATDIAVLVVAADDGIMPQTIEAINHAKAAGVQIIVAINKMDKPDANPDRVKQQLTEQSLVPEEWGGDIICVPVSAKTKTGIEDLLQNILLVAEMQELRANPDRRARGVVLEARLDKGRGPVSTLLVQAGTLHPGDIIVAGSSVGRVRAMVNENGKALTEAGPSVPVEITGLDEVPSAGDAFDAVSDERLARQLVDQRKEKAKEAEFNAARKVTLDNLFDQLEEGELKELNIIVKADVQGSVEAVRESLVKLSNDEVRVKVIHGGVGAINESDEMLAATSGAIIVGFNVRPDPVAKAAAERDGVDMRLYRVIYDCIEEIESAMKGMLAPKTREVIMGTVDVRETYKITGVGVIAGCYVTDGKVNRNCRIRVIRDGIVVAEDAIASLRRFKDDVKEVAQGYECGIGLEKYSDIKPGDNFEAFIIEEYRD